MCLSVVRLEMIDWMRGNNCRKSDEVVGELYFGTKWKLGLEAFKALHEEIGACNAWVGVSKNCLSMQQRGSISSDLLPDRGYR
jgi:hypothetical protein